MRFTVLLIVIVSANAADARDDQQLAATRLDAARLEKAVRDHPEDAFAHYQLGIVNRELGDNKSAARNLEAAIRGGFDNLGAKLNLIEAAFACGQMTLGLKTAEQVISPAVKSSEVLLRVGRVLFDHLFYKDALRAFQLALQLRPGAFEPRFRLALTYYLLDDYASTLSTLRAAGGSSVLSTPEAASLEASAEARSGHFEAATSLLRATIEKSAQSPHAYINLALIDLDRGRKGEAEVVLDQFRALGSHTDAKVFYRVGHNSCPEIADALKKGITPAASSEAKGEFYYQLAAQLQAGFNFLSAAELIRLGQINEGNSARVLLVGGASCFHQNPIAPEGVVLLRGAAARDTNPYQAYNLLGHAYAHGGRLEDAVAAYKRAVELHPCAPYYVDLGKALQNRIKALAEFERAVGLDPSYAPAHFELGRVYVEQEKFDQARLELEKAIELEPDYYEADYLLGRLHHRLGEEEQSRQMLQLFTEKKTALMQQSTFGAGSAGDSY